MESTDYIIIEGIQFILLEDGSIMDPKSADAKGKLSCIGKLIDDTIYFHEDPDPIPKVPKKKRKNKKQEDLIEQETNGFDMD